MKPSTYALILTPFLSTFTSAAALPQGTGSGLSNFVPPPPCLYACIQEYGDCAVCTPDGNANITACYLATCGNPPYGENPYAGVYYNSICQDGGYQDFTTDPHHFVTIPPSNCTS